MIDYRSPCCGKLQFRADGPVPVAIETKCNKCGEVGQPVARLQQPMHRTYECENCHRIQHCERPVQTKTHCIVCGTPTLMITAETGRINTEDVLVFNKQGDDHGLVDTSQDTEDVRSIPPRATEPLVPVLSWRETA